MVNSAIEKQQSLMYFNYMPQSLDILERQVKKIKQKNKIWKIKNNVQAIEAFQCQLTSIRVVNMLSKLQDLNVGENPQLKSLRGVQGCISLKYLNCANCDIDNID